MSIYSVEWGAIPTYTTNSWFWPSLKTRTNPKTTSVQCATIKLAKSNPSSDRDSSNATRQLRYLLWPTRRASSHQNYPTPSSAPSQTFSNSLSMLLLFSPIVLSSSTPIISGWAFAGGRRFYCLWRWSFRACRSLTMSLLMWSPTNSMLRIKLGTFPNGSSLGRTGSANRLCMCAGTRSLLKWPCFRLITV